MSACTSLPDRGGLRAACKHARRRRWSVISSNSKQNRPSKAAEGGIWLGLPQRIWENRVSVVQSTAGTGRKRAVRRRSAKLRQDRRRIFSYQRLIKIFTPGLNRGPFLKAHMSKLCSGERLLESRRLFRKQTRVQTRVRICVRIFKRNRNPSEDPVRDRSQTLTKSRGPCE